MKKIEEVELKFLDKQAESDIKFEKLKKRVIFNTLISSIALSFLLSATLSYYYISHLKVKSLKSTILEYIYPNKIIIFDNEDRPVAIADYNKSYFTYLVSNEISTFLKKELVNVEDKSFYYNSGINIDYLISDTLDILKNKKISKETITNKLIKNLTLYDNNKLISKKIYTLLYSLLLESELSKDKILELYLNYLSYKNTGTGLDENSYRLFSKFTSNLNKEESKIFLKYLINHRQNQKFKFISKSRYSYFLDYVFYELELIKHNQFKSSENIKIYSSLNRNMQMICEKSLINYLAIDKNKQGAIIFINNNGKILSLVGGKDLIKGDFNRAYQAKRSPASTFKPIIYLIALEKNLINENSNLFDTPINSDINDLNWKPQNWDKKYFGKVSVVEALYKSRNTIPIKLAQKIGINEIQEKSKLLGINNKLSDNYSIALGADGVYPIEMAKVYSTFARNGVFIEPYAIKKIKSKDQMIYENIAKPAKYMETDSTSKLNKILKASIDKMNSKILSKYNIAGKTGTSDKSRDIWFAGYNNEITGVIWIGKDNYSSMENTYSFECIKIFESILNKSNLLHLDNSN